MTFFPEGTRPPPRRGSRRCLGFTGRIGKSPSLRPPTLVVKSLVWTPEIGGTCRKERSIQRINRPLSPDPLPPPFLPTDTRNPSSPLLLPPLYSHPYTHPFLNPKCSLLTPPHISF